ncbi:MAG: hypothetical protein ABR553_11820 [Gammaproteobacteria bacterium]
MMLLQTRGLTKRFEGLHAVQGVDLDLPEGEIAAIDAVPRRGTL